MLMMITDHKLRIDTLFLFSFMCYLFIHSCKAWDIRNCFPLILFWKWRIVYSSLIFHRCQSYSSWHPASLVVMDWLLRWRHWIRPLVMTFYGLCLLVALPLCIMELNKHGAQTHVEGWFVGGLFVMMALPISLWGILQHLIHYTQPHLQRHIIR